MHARMRDATPAFFCLEYIEMSKPCDGDCESCLEYDRKLRLSCNDVDYDSVSKRLHQQWKLEHGIVKTHKRGNGKPKGTWAGTLTLSPTDPYNENDMIIAVRKLFTQQTSPVEKYAWYLEYTQNGLPHVHFIYQTPTGSRILRKVFSRVWPIWDEDSPLPGGRGHRGGYHRICADTEGYLAYIAKDGGRHDSNWLCTPTGEA